VDELCPLAVFTQCVARTRNREGAQVLFTATPMEGRTETVRMFLESTDAQMAYVTCGWKDAPHLSEDWKAKQRAVTPDYLIDAVEFGVPGRGAGAVYPVPEKEFVIDPITIPRDWMWIYGLDTGYHNTAAAWFAFDPTGDVAYLVADYKDGGGKLDVSVHASRVLSRCRGFGFENMPGVGDAAARDQSDGAQILKQYHMAGCKQLRLANKEVGSVNAGVSAFLERLQTGRLKVFRTCDKFLDEFRNYQYTTPDEKSAPRIVKTNDHILDAARYVIWGGLKFARKRSNLTVVPRMAEQTFGIYG
jgi:hypothetical protein